MKTKILSFMIIITLTTTTIIGCSNKKDNFTNTALTTDNIKNDSKDELEVVSNKEYYFDTPLIPSSYIFIEKQDGDTLIRDINAGPTIQKSINLKIENDKVISDILETPNNYNKTIEATFYIEKLENNELLITDWYSDNQYKISSSLISNENSSYKLYNNYLIEFVNGGAKNNFHPDKITLTNLEENKSISVDIPQEFCLPRDIKIVNDTLFVSMSNESAIESFDGLGYIDPNILMLIDINKGDIITHIENTFINNFWPLDDNRILFLSNIENKQVLEMYNITDKSKKELLTHSNESNSFKIDNLNVFNNNNNLYFSEVSEDKLSVKIATINNLNIENINTIYESSNSQSDIYITINQELNMIKIYSVNSSEEIDKLTEVILNN